MPTKPQSNIPQPAHFSLRQIIHRHFLAGALLPLLLIETVLLTMYFGLNLHLAEESTNILGEQALLNLGRVSRQEALNLDGRLAEAGRLARMMQADHQQFFARPDEECRQPNGPAVLKRHANGAMYKSNNNGGASLYYAATTKIGQQEQQQAICSEAIDPLLKNIVDNNPIIAQAYLNTRDDMNRLYPFMTDAPGQYGPAIHMADYNFYYLADGIHNPERLPVWTEAYLDPAGLGWMASVIVPVWHDGLLQGVSGLDVTIDTFVSEVLDLDLPWNGSAFLVDSNGVILAMPERVEALFGLKELRDHVYKNSVSGTVTKPEDFNLNRVTDTNLRQHFSDMFAAGQAVTKAITIGGDHYLVHFESIPETGWRLVTLVNRDDILAPVSLLKAQGYNLGFIAIAGMIIFYVLFFMYLVRRSHAIAARIVSPLDSLSNQTALVGSTRAHQEVEKVGILEIDRLSTNFNHMKSELDKRASDLVDATVDRQMLEKEQELLARLAARDGLTNLYNRRKIEEKLLQELARANRYTHGFGIILLDIDHFKSINDNHGHGIGDDVLQDLGILLQDHCRTTDIPGRWGGEEFIILCPEADEKGLVTVAEKIRTAIEYHKFDFAGIVTASLGLAVLTTEDDINSLLKRADSALYEAKNAGRNRTVMGKP